MSRDTGLDVTMLQAQAAVQSRAIDALAADVARVQGAVRMLVETLTPDPGRAPSDYWPLAHGESAAILAAMAAPAPDPAPLIDGYTAAEWASVGVEAPDPAPLPHRSRHGQDEPGEMPDCPRCGNNRQVWRNQISGRLRCHRVGCETDLPSPPALPATCPFCGKRPFRRVQYRDRKWHVWCFDCGANGPEADSEADALATWARAMPPMLDAETRALMLDARMAVLGYRDTIRRGSSPEASSFRDRMDALASALRAAAGPTP